MRRLLLSLLPKVALSRTTGALTSIPVPRGLRAPFYRWFAKRYGADLDQVAGELTDYRSLAAFFGRPLVEGARPVPAGAELVWPCDGRIVTAGPVTGGRIPQVKGVDYALDDFLGDAELAARLADGSQATIYLAPGDYHRVHTPWAGKLTAQSAIRGTLFPVNPPAVRCIPELFVRNARRVFRFELADGRAAAVVMVGALNVGSIVPTLAVGAEAEAGDELGRFGFGSTAVALLEGGDGPQFPAVAPETVVRTAAAVPTGDDGGAR